MNFIDFASANGLIVDRLYPSEKINRCPSKDHPRSKNGAWYWNGERGFVQAWDGDGEVKWFGADRAWTEQEKKSWVQDRRKEDAARAERYRLASVKAQQMLKEATQGEHNYLHIKGFGSEKGFVLNDVLLIPMRSLDGALAGLQQIKWLPDEMRYEKKMLSGMKAKDATFRIGSKSASETFLCEGYATGLSIAQALRSIGNKGSVLVCFSDSNLVSISKQIKGRAFVVADNDASGAGQRAAEASGLPWCMSQTVGHDANDDHQRNGILVVAKMLMEVRQR